jgi:hypothetical protein
MIRVRPVLAGARMRGDDLGLAALTIGALFYCRAKKRRVSVQECLTRYVDATALELQRSACWRCPQGKRNRGAFAMGG